ncbi:MAG: hypothetical protein KatS3mg038_2110 [Candidatus Kapaibacterium sp.]|nr:MAG: hypothetical protein KatS3mg038_2110 [Candidatus Kapabacteria bacterium]
MRTRVAAAIAGLAVAFGRDPSETLISAYVWALDDLGEESIEQAVKRALKECRTMPTPAELRELAGVRRPEDQALVAWETAMRAVQRVGFYKSPDFADALINATIHNLGGWRIFVQRCDDAEDQKFLRMDFIRTYASFARCGPPPGSTGPLQGEFARVNALMGHVGPNDAPVLVGDDGRPGEQQPITIDSRPKLPMPFRRLPE